MRAHVDGRGLRLPRIDAFGLIYVWGCAAAFTMSMAHTIMGDAARAGRHVMAYLLLLAARRRPLGALATAGS